VSPACLYSFVNPNGKTRYIFFEQESRGRGVDSMSFSVLTRVFRLSYDVDDGWGPGRIQSIIMSLVAQVRA
jgi:hypothetical protein